MTNPARPELVRVQTADRVATITLDSPANANALSTALVTQLREAVERALADPGVTVIVLTGAGRVFCSGADLKEALTSPTSAPGLMAGALQLLWDIAIAVESATFAFSEVRIGVAPAVISVPCLRRMPSRAAAEYFLTGEVFDAARATEIGLLTRAVPAPDLDGETDRYAAMLLRGAPGAIAATKAVLRDVPADTFADGLRRMADLSASLFGADEAREGMTAFAAKREPAWVSRTER
jgi:methylglutaconyl-CoA hydratase